MIRTLAAALATSTCIVALASPAAAQTREYNIPAGSLKSALDAYVRQSGRQVVYRADQVRSARSPGTRGQQSAEAALSAILSGSGFTTRADGNLIAIVREGNGSVAEAPLSRSEDNSNEDIVVTGSNIRGIQNRTVPVSVIDRKQIEATGISTTTRLIETLPQNFALANQSAVNQPGVTAGFHQGSSVNLRGVGEGTTLVLLNGRRLPLGYGSSSVDISAIPLSALQRVEVLTDGASALYGSDAIGGVINFVLRQDFEGLDVSARVGFAPGSINEYRASSTFGQAWSSGNFLISGEYFHRDLLRVSDRSFVPSTVRAGSLLPQDNNKSIMISGQQKVGETVTIFAEGLYTQRDAFSFGGVSSESYSTDNPQFSATVGTRWKFARDWQLEFAGGMAENRLEQLQDYRTRFGYVLGFNNRFRTRTADVKLDGPIVSLPGGQIRAAIGANLRSEKYDYQSGIIGGSIARKAFDQTVKSVYGELYVPVVGTGNATAGIERLELSLAARYDDYSSFGSSIDPKVGLMWEPFNGFRLRGAYSTSYKAPNLQLYDLGGNNSNLRTAFLDPGSSTGRSNIIEIRGSAVDTFRAQSAESLTLGAEWSPPAVPNLTTSVNYYSIKYRNRISAPPAISVILNSPSNFSGLIDRSVSSVDVQAAIDLARLGLGFFVDGAPCANPCSINPSSVNVIVDRRTANISEINTSGIDLAIKYMANVAGGQLSLGGNFTYIFDIEQRLTSTAPAFSTIDTFNNPTDFRLRAYVGWERSGWSANIFANHTDGYQDNRTTPAMEISDYTTLDARIAYSTGDQGWLHNTTFAIGAQNLFDAKPPSTRVISVTSDLGFDPANANPLGRLLTFELTKRF